MSSRLWEIRISQIPFGSRAPSGCLQHFTGIEGKHLRFSLAANLNFLVLPPSPPAGIIQTFNFADNGRHLANQNYKSCIRQEKGRCSIQYEPCNDQSFRIGGANGGNGANGAMGGMGTGGESTGTNMR